MNKALGSGELLLAGGKGGGLEDKLGRGRLVVALDALLSNRSVTAAAKELGLQTSALSRLLTQLRGVFEDEIFVRSGRGMVPTPFAAALRPQIRKIAAEMDTIFDPQTKVTGSQGMQDAAWNVPSSIEAAPLSVRPAHLLEGEPSPGELSNKQERRDETASAADQLARYIGLLGVGGGRHGRPLTLDEAAEAMGIVLEGEADPIQLGAFLGMIHTRGATAQELAGFIRAARSHVAGRIAVTSRADFDWPCYMSPNYHNPPWFFHAARLLSQSGYRVVLHGSTGTGERGGRHEVIAASLGIPVASAADEIASSLEAQGIVYIPLAVLSPQLYRMIGLYRLLQNRSVAFEMVHLLAPVPCRTSLLGVAKTSYKAVHRDAARLLNWQSMSVLESVRDVAQFMPYRASGIYGLENGENRDLVLPPQMDEPPATPRPRGTNLEYWQAVWTGAIRDGRAEQIIVSTAAFALFSLPGSGFGDFAQALEQARCLWRDRRPLENASGGYGK